MIASEMQVPATASAHISNEDWASRIAAIVGVALLHLAAYYLVTRVNSARPATALWDPETALDGLIPYLPWTWPFYWAAYPYITIGAATLVLALPHETFRRSVGAYAAMCLLGAALQLAIPVEAPWPETPHRIQRILHDSSLVRPYASLPSMHVAYSIFTAYLGIALLNSRWLRAMFFCGAALITVSTLTLKEHFVLDTASGAALGLMAAALWRASLTKRSESE